MGLHRLYGDTEGHLIRVRFAQLFSDNDHALMRLAQAILRHLFITCYFIVDAGPLLT